MKRGTTRTLGMILVLATVILSSGIAMAQGFGVEVIHDGTDAVERAASRSISPRDRLFG